MKSDDFIVYKFDPETEILHVSAREIQQIATVALLDELCFLIRRLISRLAGNGRIYLVVDLEKFIIDPKLADVYGAKISDIYYKYIHPGGLARYGIQITRLTIQVGHKKYIGGDPNLFKTEAEAFAYMENLIKRSTEQCKKAVRR